MEHGRDEKKSGDRLLEKKKKKGSVTRNRGSLTDVAPGVQGSRRWRTVIVVWATDRRGGMERKAKQDESEVFNKYKKRKEGGATCGLGG